MAPVERMRHPHIDLTRTHAALLAWLEERDQSEHAWEWVWDAYLLVERLESAQSLHKASRDLLAMQKPTAAALAILTKTAAALASLAQNARDAETSRRHAKLRPGYEDAGSVIFNEVEISLVRRVHDLSKKLEAALSSALSAVSSPRRQPAPHAEHLGRGVLLELVSMLRSGGLTWPEIGRLIIDDYDVDTGAKARGERYRKLSERKSGGQLK